MARVEDAAADSAPCPDCGTQMADLGLDFKPPRRSAVQHWAVVEFLHRRGFAYHPCGCDGPGYRPSRGADMPVFLDAHRCRAAAEILAARFADRRRARGTVGRRSPHVSRRGGRRG